MMDASTNMSYVEDGLMVPDEYPLLEDTEFYMNSAVIPALCIFGVIGNILNLIVLGCRYFKPETDSGEKSALLGLVALAVSDMFFCVGTIPSAFHDGFQTVFYTKSVWMYYQMYDIFYKNVFIKTSTCLTTIIAFSRYLAICYPLRFRHCSRLFVMKVTVVAAFILWTCINIPLLWSFKIHTLPAVNSNISIIYIMDVGDLTSNEALRMCFTYVWAMTGYFIPLALMTFCNVKLVKALYRSQRLRLLNARYCRPTARNNRSRITITLIALTIMYLLLVSPSEILHFYMDTAHTQTTQSLERAVVCTNLLQVINFSCHFILYCAVNSTFRGILVTSCRRFWLPQKCNRSTSNASFRNTSRHLLDGRGSMKSNNKNSLSTDSFIMHTATTL